ncbi:hypothetical protein [Bacteroides sp.]
MKKISQSILIIALCILGVCMNSCNEDETFTVFPTPVWRVESNPDYSVSMTATVVLPANLAAYAQADDQMAAFVGDECRGVAYLVDNTFYLLIKGSPGEQSQISIRYYSARNQYMYTTGAVITFEADGVYGTTDDPVTLPLSIINE